MVEFHLVYNPYIVESQLYVRKDTQWIPVLEESGLLYISNLRMQRWLRLPQIADTEYDFFEDLCKVSGEDEVSLLFSGTKEDFCDINVAAKLFNQNHHERVIRVSCDKNTEENSCNEKLSNLQQILNTAKKSNFGRLLPRDIWNSAKNIIAPIGTAVTICPMIDWQERDLLVFSEWRLVILTISFETMRYSETRQALRMFSRSFFDKELEKCDLDRFIIVCTTPLEATANTAFEKAKVEKLLMEYGLHVIRSFLITETAFSSLDDIDSSIQDIEFQDLRQCIELFITRYAEQFRLRKSWQVLRQNMKDAGYGTNSQNMDTIQHLLGRDTLEAIQVSDEEIFSARKWISEFQEQLEHLLDVYVNHD